jgi:hypothetical protein
MIYVQHFERGLRLFNVAAKGLKIATKKTPLADEEVTRFLSVKEAIGPTLQKLRKHFEAIGLQPFPSTTARLFCGILPPSTTRHGRAGCSRSGLWKRPRCWLWHDRIETRCCTNCEPIM